MKNRHPGNHVYHAVHVIVVLVGDISKLQLTTTNPRDYIV